MKAFIIGGENQWNVIAQGNDGSDICVSDVAKFDKSAYSPPKEHNNNGSSDEDNSSSGSGSDGGPIIGVDGGHQ